MAAAGSSVSLWGWGTQTRLAHLAGISPQCLNDYLNARKNASAPVADRLAAITRSNIRIWLLGGDVQARREAVTAWEKESSFDRGSV